MNHVCGGADAQIRLGRSTLTIQTVTATPGMIFFMLYCFFGFFSYKKYLSVLWNLLGGLASNTNLAVLGGRGFLPDLRRAL